MNGDASSAATKIANAVNASERIASRRDTARSTNAIQSANRPPKNVTCVTVSGWPPYNITVQTMTANTKRRYVRCSINSSIARNANRQPHRDGDDRKVQPGDDERAERKRDRADRGRKF